MFGQSGEESATASYPVLSSAKGDTELLIATNNHVVENADTLQVEFNDGTKASADIKGTDSSKDLAVVAVKSATCADGLGEIAVATLGDSDSLTVGEPAIAIGNALGYMDSPLLPVSSVH